jgi:hypothetical protein
MPAISSRHSLSSFTCSPHERGTKYLPLSRPCPGLQRNPEEIGRRYPDHRNVETRVRLLNYLDIRTHYDPRIPRVQWVQDFRDP